MAQVQVLPVEDGGNPRGSEDIREREDGFLVVPFSEDGDGNYKFRLNVALLNSSSQAIPTCIVVEWDDPEYMSCRDYLLLTRGEDWKRFPAEVRGTTASATIPVPPGESQLGLHPPYSYGDFRNLVDSLPERLFRIHRVGESLHQRDILAVEVGSPTAERPMVLIFRIHPYESEASYFADGMLRHLAEDTAGTERLLADRRLVFIPVPNPDGVAEGTCKRTAGGDNLSLGAENKGPESVALKAFLTDLRPAAYFDLHSWMIDRDGFFTNDIARGEAFASNLKAQPGVFDKEVRMQLSTRPEGGQANLAAYLEKEFGTLRLVGSCILGSRGASHLRNMGVEMLKAYLAHF